MQVFLAMSSQWRIVAMPNGLFFQGLDYAALPAVMRWVGVPPAERADCFAGLQILEAAAAQARNART